MKRLFVNAGAEAAGTSPELLLTTVKSEMTRLGEVIKDANIRDE